MALARELATRIADMRYEQLPAATGERVGPSSSLPFPTEEILQPGAAFGGEHPRGYRRVMVQSSIREEIHHAAARSRLGIRRAEHQPGDPGVDDRSGAHRAGLESHMQLATGQAVVARVRGSFAQRQDLRVR